MIKEMNVSFIRIKAERGIKMIYGYARISRKTMNIERQVRNILAAYPSAQVIKEEYTGTQIEGRKRFVRLCNMVKAGDTIVFDSVSRMSRNAVEGFAAYKELYERGINLVFLKERHIDTETYRNAAERQGIDTISTGDEATDELLETITQGINRYIMRLAEQQIMLAFLQSEKEVSDLHQRTKEGIETARRNGKQIGLAKGTKLKIKKEAPAKEAIRKYSKDFEGTLDDAATMKLAGVSHATYYKYKRELRETLED